MSKIKLDDRLQSALNAFIDLEPGDRSFATNKAVAIGFSLPTTQTFIQKADKWSKVLRELLLFGPGVFCLYSITLMVIFFYPEAGLTFGGLFMLAAASFITYAGSGDLRKINNLAVPATVIAGAATVSIIRSLFPVPDYLRQEFSYAFYLFPFTLVLAKLVQMRLANKS